MAELRIRLEVDPKTGKKQLVIDYASDSDALPVEHEEEHRRLVEKLAEGMPGKPLIEREREAAPEEAAEADENEERESVGQGS